MLIRIIFFLLLVAFCKNATGCMCNFRPIDTSFKNSSIVVTATMIGEDSVVMAQHIYTDKKGIRFDRRRYKLDSAAYRRLIFIVTKNYKSTVQVPDTVYILIEKRSDCIYHFPRYYGGFGPDWNSYILFADNISEYTIVSTMKKKRKVKKINKIVIPNAFYVDQCSSTQRNNETALAELEKLKI